MLPEVSQPVVGIYIMVTGVYIAVVFHDGDSPAFGLENAKGMFLVKCGAQGLFESLDGNRSDIVFRPFIKDFSQRNRPKASAGTEAAVTPVGEPDSRSTRGRKVMYLAPRLFKKAVD